MAKEEHPEDLLGQISGCLAEIEESLLPEIELRLRDIRSTAKVAQKLCDRLEKWVYNQLT